MIDCPNCGQAVDESAAVCPNCGFDIHSELADEVRQLRDEGQIHPGRLDPDAKESWEGGDPRQPQIQEGLPAEDFEQAGPEELETGL
jgi:hypothetical protein